MKTIIISLMAALAMSLWIFGLSCNEGNDESDTSGNDQTDDDQSEPCLSTCWQHSPEEPTGSWDQVETWAAACENADSGCTDKICVATYLKFYNAPEELQYAVQCETDVPNDKYNDCLAQDALVTTYWLGPEYGNLSPDICYDCPWPFDATTGWNNAPGDLENAPVWDEDKISDALVHEIGKVLCDQITDYRQCVRAFIPPDIHCVPNFTVNEHVFDSCYAVQEPHNRDVDWLIDYNTYCQ